MGRIKYSYHYDHDTNTTTITSIKKVGGKLITASKTVEGNQIPQKSDVQSKIVLGIVALAGLNILSIAPALIVTPITVFGALKLTEKKKTNEKVIASVGAGVLSLVACGMLFKPPVPTPSRTTVDSRTKARRELQNIYGNCKTLPNGQFVCPVNNQ